MDELAEFHKALEIESEALAAARERLGEPVVKAIDILGGCRGKILVMGMGKCGLIGNKIAATFASTGTPAMSVHPAEAVHGDLGFIDRDDAALILSYSGETSEVIAVMPHLKRMGVRSVVMTGRPESTLAKSCDVILDTRVDREADPLNMAPTASALVMLAVGDALAAVFMKKRDFSADEFYLYHPGGSLGQTLSCLVEDLMHTDQDLPLVDEGLCVKDTIFEITSKRLGAAFVIDKSGTMVGLITDGDLRRAFQRDPDLLELPAQSIMTQRPKTVDRNVMAVDALRMMEDDLVTILPVVDGDHKPVGAIHIHDLIRAGIK